MKIENKKQIEKEDLVKFTYETSVLANHLNYANHLGYDSILSILQEARIQWIKSLNQDSSETNIENNVGWLVRRVEVDYLSEGHYGDNLAVHLSITNIKKIKFDINHEVYNASTKNILCRARITMVCFNFEKLKTCKLPNLLGLIPSS